MFDLQSMETMAKSKNGDVSKMSFVEKQLYLSLVGLYDGYRHKVYTVEEAKKIKKLLIEDYKQNQLWEDIYRNTAEIRNRYSPVLTEAEKHGCPICKKLVRVFERRE